jgi:hypothetical protein
MVLPKIFVGTLYSREGDMPHVTSAIARQKHVTITHVVISDYPEREAHNRLWASWRENQHKHSMFVKIDADTVLAHDEVLCQLWQLMSSNPRITGIQAPLHDFLTDSYINGLNCFSPKVIFQDSKDDLYCDRQVDIGHDITVKSADVPNSLRPAGLHCYHATPLQAFHFGVHRTLKNQVSVIQQLQKACRNDGEKLTSRAYALAGVRYAYRFTHNAHFNYNDQLLHDAFLDADLEVRQQYAHSIPR